MIFIIVRGYSIHRETGVWGKDVDMAFDTGIIIIINYSFLR